MAVRDVVQAAAGVGGGGEYIEDVFSTYLYTGNGSTQTITNKIDLSGEGGLVWSKSRSSRNHVLIDTERGAGNCLFTNLTNANDYDSSTITSFNSDGYSIGSSAFKINTSGENFASWTFRKAPKFFDVVTWTGNSVFGRQIPHNLGSVPGCIIVKRTNAAASWYVYHRGVDASAPQDYTLVLDLDLARINSSAPWADTAPTDSVFTVGDNSNYNETGSTYVAYLFAHDAGGFGDDGEQNIISCGSYTGNGTAGTTLDLGFEPQWILFKRTDSADDWYLFDSMRELTTSISERLRPNTSDEAGRAFYYIPPNATGITFNASGGGALNTSGASYIYIAIRRGPMKTPESGTEVFAIDTLNGSPLPSFTSGFPVDMALMRYNVNQADDPQVATRLLQGKQLLTSSTSVETENTAFTFDYNEGWGSRTTTVSNWYSWMFRRAPGFFDVVAYTPSYPTAVKHNLGVPYELKIDKARNFISNWNVVWDDGTTQLEGELNNNSALSSQARATNTSTEFLSTFDGALAVSYLFASCPGVSKVSSYTGTAADINIDCGFSSGARFVLIKRTDSTGDWYVWDSARGIVSGNDPYLLLNSTAAENTSTDYIDPLASGFTVTSSAPAALNASGGSYIFLAIA